MRFCVTVTAAFWMRVRRPFGYGEALISKVDVTGVLKQISKYFGKKVSLACTSRWDVLILRSFVQREIRVS